LTGLFAYKKKLEDMLMARFFRGPSRLIAPLSAAIVLASAASASAEGAPRVIAKVAAPAPDAPAAKPEAPVAAPESTGKESPAWDSVPATHRSGFVVGLALGAGVVAFSGYPNDARKIGLLSNYTETGASLGGMGSLWLGGALSDWFTFGVGFTGGSMPLLSDQKASSGGLIFHIEAYPLFTLGKRWRDVGVMFDAGTGSATVTPKDSEKMLVDSGSASLIGAGPFYEGFKLWKLKGGPYIEGSYMWSDSVRRPGVFFGWRTSFYTGI
jgi:hypothetical protein